MNMNNELKIKKYVSIINLGDEIVTRKYYVGHKSDIKAMYKSICRNNFTSIRPLFCDFPRFSEHREIYALCIDDNYFMSITTSDTMMAIILDPSCHTQEIR